MILSRFNLPTLSHIAGDSIFLQNGYQGLMWTFKPLDVESQDEVGTQTFQSVLERVGTRRLCFKLRKSRGREISALNHRHTSHFTLPIAAYNGVAFLDWYHPPNLFRTPDESAPAFDDLKFKQFLCLKPSIEEDVQSEFEWQSKQVTHRGSYLDFGDYLVGAVRIYKPAELFNTLDFAQIIAELGVGSEFFTSIRQLDSTRSEVILRSLKNRQAGLGGNTSRERVKEVDDALRGIALNQEKLIEIEQVILVQAPDEKTLRYELGRTIELVKNLGRAMIETDGLPETFFATKVGGHTHSQFYDSSRNLGSYLPIYTFRTKDTVQGNERRSLVLNRLDDSTHYFDIFNPSYLAFNGLIIGKTGSGKSVLTNLLTQSLLNDPSIQVVKIDVGGSYRKECQYVKGEEISFEMSEPSGLNPFTSVKDVKDKGSLELLSHFICELLKEVDERAIPKEMRSSVESEIQKYIESESEPSLDGFYEKSDDFPRKSLLRRWVRGGIFEHVFSIQTVRGGSRYRYYNFQNILGAGSREFCHGIMAAVILEINSEILQAGDRLSNHNRKRIALFCDETKFFLDQNQEFFLLTTANFRKYGHSVFLINQSLENFTLVRNGIADRSLIINSPIRLLLQADYDEAELCSEFNLSDLQLDRIVKNPYRGREYRDLVLQDDTGTRVCRLRLTPEEYFRASSSVEDNLKISRMLEFIPGLTLDEAVRCLSISSLL